jgi:hypothetical protein
VGSYGTSGNFLFNTTQADPRGLERRIARRVGTAAFVRTRTEMSRVVAADPFRERSGVVLFLARAPGAAARRRFRGLKFEQPRPVLRGRTVFYVYPATLRGRRTPVDFERMLGIPGTFRSSRVVERLLALMQGPAARRP